MPLISSHEPHPPPNTITSRIKILNAWVWGHKYWVHKQSPEESGRNLSTFWQEGGALRGKSSPLAHSRDSCTWNIHHRSHLEFHFHRRNLQNCSWTAPRQLHTTTQPLLLMSRDSNLMYIVPSSDNISEYSRQETPCEFEVNLIRLVRPCLRETQREENKECVLFLGACKIWSWCLLHIVLH